jgi:thymidylate synthase (FAD)
VVTNAKEIVLETVAPTVRVIAYTRFDPPDDVPWFTDSDGGQALAEFAGRACYQSWNKPNHVTATNAGYLRHILEVGHLSVLEHGTVTFYLTGVSRSFTHELVRHRHFSYSQLSQRFVAEHNAAMVEPAIVADDPELHALFTQAANQSLTAYAQLVNRLEAKLSAGSHGSHRPTSYLPDGSPYSETCHQCGKEWPCRTARTAAHKGARQAARAVLPNATETSIVVTGNYRSWRHFITMRATEHADVEISAVAVACLRELQRIAPNVFADFTITTLADGTETAASPYMWES